MTDILILRAMRFLLNRVRDPKLRSDLKLGFAVALEHRLKK
jgi:hypothetical protein